MSQRGNGFRFGRSHAGIPAVIVAALGLVACDSAVGSGSTGVGGGGGGTADAGADTKTAAPGPGSKDPVPGFTGNDNPDVITPCAQTAAKAQTMLQTYCSSCHGADSPGRGGFKAVLDVPTLISSGKIIPKNAEGSPLYKRLASRAMPPADVQKRPADADIQLINDWIGCGAPDWNGSSPGTLEFVSIDTRLRAILDDLRDIPADSDRQDTRYIDLSNLANAGFTDEQIQVYREGVSFTINSLSRGRAVREPVAIDEAKLIYRISLDDYEWDAAKWNLLEAVYPYAVIYDDDSRLFPFDETTAEQIREETGTNIPVIQGDWFLSHATRPPLYHDLLDLPATLPELEQQLGVSIEENIADEQVLRSGFKTAGPSQNHRIIERHELNGNRGAFWVSYDFANNVAQRNIFANPLDFQEDGGEFIFNLDNGLQGYYIAEADGGRLDKAPTNVVQDPLSRDGAVENGLSCMTCHQEDGQLPKFDEVRDFVLSTGSSAEETEIVLALYPEREVLQEAFNDDQNRYRTARAALGISKLGATTLHTLDDTHLSLLDLNMVAAVLGIPATDLKRALDATPQIFPPEIVALRTEGGGVQRDAFEDVVDDLITALGLGDQLLVTQSGQIRSVNR